MSISSITGYGAIKGLDRAPYQSALQASNVKPLPNYGSEPIQPELKEVRAAVDNLNKFIVPVINTIIFSVTQDSGKVIVKVLDAETQKVLRQIPNAEAVTLSKTLDKLQGLIVRDKA
jgi:flagellar protein FlaG